jgi:small-conductance mechanosensitive channel
MGEGERKMSVRVLAILWLTACASIARAQHEPVPEPAVLTMWNRPIVTFRATVSEVTPEQRAQNALARIDAHIERRHSSRVGTRYAEIGDAKGFLVTLDAAVAFGIVAQDIDPESELTLEQTAARAADQLRAVLAARDKQQRAGVLARGFGLTLAAIIVFVVAIRLVVALRELAVRKIDAFLRNRKLAIGGLDIVPTLATVERATFRVLSWGAIAAVTYLIVTFILQAFPYTEPLGDRLGVYLRQQAADTAIAVVKSMPSLVAIVAVLLITRALALWSSRLLAEVEHGARVVRWPAQEQARATRRIANGLIWILGAAIAYSLLPWSGSPIFRGMSLVLGLGASLASAGLMNQWISGLVVLYARSFRIGDYVRIGETEGIITEMGPLATKVRSIRREEITIPNAVMTTEKLINFTRLSGADGALLSVPIAIGYNVSWRRVQELLVRAARETPGLRSDPAPRVLQWGLSDFSVEYHLHTHLERAEDRTWVRSELQARILDSFMTAGVQIMTPHFEAQPDKPVIAGQAAAFQ